MWVAMSAAEREEFLAGVRVGGLSAAMGTAGQTLVVPVWYSYQLGGLLMVLTGRRSRKAGAIRAAGRLGLCVQDARPPYRYVSKHWMRVSRAPSEGGSVRCEPAVRPQPTATPPCGAAYCGRCSRYMTIPATAWQFGIGRSGSARRFVWVVLRILG
jgi:hypothetical protein